MRQYWAHTGIYGRNMGLYGLIWMEILHVGALLFGVASLYVELMDVIMNYCLLTFIDAIHQPDAGVLSGIHSLTQVAYT